MAARWRDFRVTSINNKRKVRIEPEGGGPEECEPEKNLLVVKRFGDPIFPSLAPLGAVRRAPTSKPHHAVINGENFHALQLLVYMYEGQVDCIYIDPPYNTGARDWKYNNRYVDSADAWRHSKWLSMMEKRLRLARRLLKEISTRSALTHVWLVTDSEDAFAEMRTALPPTLKASMLYRDYLRTFRINTRQNL